MLSFAIKRLAITLLSLSIATFAAAAQQPPTIHDINEINGFGEALVGLQDGLSQARENIPGPVPDGFADAWALAAAGTFDPVEVRGNVEAAMEGRLSPSDLAALHAFYVTPLARKITQFEVETSRRSPDETKSEEAGLLAELAASPPERQALYRRIADDLDLVDTGEAMALNMAYAVVVGLVGAASSR